MEDWSILHEEPGSTTLVFTWLDHIKPLNGYALKYENNNTSRINEKQLIYGYPATVAEYFGKVCEGVHYITSTKLKHDECLYRIDNYRKKYCDDISANITCVSDGISIIFTTFPLLEGVPFLANISISNYLVGSINTLASYKLCGEKVNFSLTSGIASIFYPRIVGMFHPVFVLPKSVGNSISGYECLFNLIGW